MYLGKIVEIGSAEEIIHDPTHPYTKALRWATPNIHPDSADDGDPPVRHIDIPDPIDPPDGCRFHPRCPEAREICRRSVPSLTHVGDESAHESACYRAHGDEHDYWDSPSITEDD